MDLLLKEILWEQFGASIDMLENAIMQCPDELWYSKQEFWYIAYHTLFYLDYYLDKEPASFKPPPPFTLSEFDPSGALPEKPYSKEELLNYLGHGRQKCHQLISGLNPETVLHRFINEQRNYNILEILLYNMRHVQHHAAQLNLLLRQNINHAPRWVSQTKMGL